MPPLRSWPEWLRYTLTGMAGVAVTLVSITTTFGDVRRDASDAKAGVESHRPRIESLEQFRAASDERWLQVRDALLEIKARLPR